MIVKSPFEYMPSFYFLLHMFVSHCDYLQLPLPAVFCFSPLVFVPLLCSEMKSVIQQNNLE